MAVILLRWNDDYLSWDQMPYSSFYTNQVAQMPAGLLWWPHIILANTVDIHRTLDITNGSTLDIAQDGTVTAYIFTQLVASCEVDARKYKSIPNYTTYPNFM